jgi:hypothetical protein
MKADKSRRPGDQYRLIRHYILKDASSAQPRRPSFFTCHIKGVAIPSLRLLPDRLLNHTKAAKFGARRCF